MNLYKPFFPHFLFLAILVNSIGTLAAQPYNKVTRKVEKKYATGSYKTAYKINQKTLNGLEANKSNNQVQYIRAVFNQAANAEAINNYYEIDILVKKGLAELETISLDSALIHCHAYKQLSFVYLQAKDYITSLRYINKAISLASSKLPSNETLKNDLQLDLAQIFFHTGYYNEALAILNSQEQYRINKTLEKEPGKKEAKVIKKEYAKFLNLKASILLQKGKYNSADSLIASNDLWIRKKIGKRDFTYRDQLINNGFSAKTKGDLKKASKYFEKANKYTKFRPLEKSGQNVQEQLIEIYYARNKKHDAIVQRIKFERKARYVYGKNSIAYARYRFQEVNQLYFDSKYDKAEKKLDDIYKTKTQFPDNHKVRQEILDMKIKIATRKSNFDLAFDSLQKMVAIKKVFYGENSPEYHKELLRLSDFYANYSNNFAAAKAINERSFPGIVGPQLDPQSKQYIAYMQQLANLYELTEKYDQAVKYLEDAGAYLKLYYGSNADYASDLEKLASVMLKKGDYVKAEELIKQAVEIFKKTSVGSANIDRSSTYLTLAKLYTTLGLYEEAENALAKASKLSKKSRKQNATATAKSSDELAGLYIRQGRYNEAEDLLNSTLELKEKKLSKDNRELIPTLNALGNLYLITGNYTASEKIIRRSMLITGKIFGESSVRYTESLRLLETLYKELGDFKKAEETANQVLNIQKTQLGNNHIEVAAALTQLAQIKLYTGSNLLECEKLLNEALTIVKFNLGDKNPTYAEQLKYLANLYIETKRYEKADSALNTANTIYLEKLGKNNINSAEIAFLKGNIYIQKGDYLLAQQKYAESRNLYSVIFSKQHPGYVKATSKLARAFYMTADYAKSQKMLDESTNNYLEFTKKYFPSLSFSEKSKFWNQIKDDFEFYNSLAFKVAAKNQSIMGNVYDNLMATKALLLSSSIKVKERILNSKDEILIARYNEWTGKKQLLISAISMNKEAQQEAGLDPLKLEKEINSLEKELSESSELFAENFEKQNFSWKSLKAVLKPNEYAIELLRFRYFNKGFTDSVIYAALIISNKSEKAPEVVILPEAKNMEGKYLKYYKNVIINKLDEDDYSYNAYWKPIKDKLPDNATVYLSSEGVYNEINIESLKAADNSYPIDKNLIIPVSNTKDLFTKNNEVKVPASAVTASRVALFGNPTFYASAKQKNQQTAEDRSVSNADMYATASKNIILQLPGTEVEVNEINTLFESKGWKINKYVSDKAEEDSIKMMKSPKVLHIATHGYFNPDAGDASNTEGAESEFASNPLLRSGLLLKGAGDVLKSNNSLKINSENGILTAYEAMDLNLDNTDLVVLSACETGKGEVQLGEGVFGLQRAILVAGANTLIMTLFKVNDDITKELMITFYKQWLQTGELRKSFTDAKKSIKSKYKYPVYWGSFVMVGLE